MMFRSIVTMFRSTVTMFRSAATRCSGVLRDDVPEYCDTMFWSTATRCSGVPRHDVLEYCDTMFWSAALMFRCAATHRNRYTQVSIIFHATRRREKEYTDALLKEGRHAEILVWLVTGYHRLRLILRCCGSRYGAA